MYVISVPISVPVTGKKKFYLNLNQYRNAHHFTLSKAKTNYHDIVAPLLKSLPAMTKIHLEYCLFTGSHQLCDTANICSIVDKFFSDVLVASQKISDDNCHIVLSVVYRYGGVDKSDPRVEVTITPDEFSSGSPPTNQQQRKEPMQITINQEEIEQAIRERVLSQITIAENMQIKIDLKATRGDEGYTAVIDIVPQTASKPARAASSPSVSAPRKPISITKVTAPAAAAPAKPEPEVQAAAEPVVETAEEPDMSSEAQGDEIPVDNSDNASAAEEAPAATETVAEQPAARPSLFASLKKPENA